MKKLLLLLTVVFLGSAAAWAQTQAPITPNLGQKTTFEVTPTVATGKTLVDYETTFFIVGGGSTDIGGSSSDLIAEAKLSSSAATTGDFTATETENQTETPSGSGNWVKNGTFTGTVDGSKHTFTVTWNGESSGEAFYVFAKTNDGCSDNYRAWKVVPKPSPWYITNVELASALGVTTATEGICPSSDIKAKYVADAGTPANSKFTYDYGTSAMYIKVTTDGDFGGDGDLTTGTWTPSVTLVNQNATPPATGDKTSTLSLDTEQALEKIVYYAATATNPVPTSDADYTSAVAYTDQSGTPVAGDATGSTVIFIKIPISNGEWAALSEQGYSIYVDGIDNTNVIDGKTNPALSNGFDGTDDVINQTINARPTVAANAPTPVNP